MMSGVQSWLRMAYYSQIVKHLSAFFLAHYLDYYSSNSFRQVKVIC